ncbi:MAG: hypothetical protein ACM3O5_00460 [Betaproteobacteria bacterium]
MMPSGALDRYIPAPDVRERFETTVHAPAALVMEVATGFDLQSLRPVRAIFRLREVFMRSAPHARRRPQGLLEEMRELGWGVLAEEPGRLVVCGARCQPWLADVKFTAIAPESFERYAGPDQVKIAWSLEADALSPDITRFAQETRAVGTDAAGRLKFLRYWRWARYGIVSVRLLMLPAVRREAERRWRRGRSRV